MSKELGYVPSSGEVKRLRELIENGKSLEAWNTVKDLPGLREWRGFEGRNLAGRLASVFGDPHLSTVIDFQNWRENRDNDRAYFRALFGRFAFKASTLMISDMEERLKTVDRGAEVYCDLKGLLAACYCDVREFSKAHDLLDEAMAESLEPSWLFVQRSVVYRREDHYDEALVAIEEGRKLRPYYRPVVEVHAEALTNLGRDAEALDSLKEASSHSDNPAFPVRLSAIYSERDDVEQTGHWLNEYERKSPLLPKKTKEWLAGRRADLAYLEGDIDRFIELTDQTAKKSFYRRCVKHYRENNGAEGKRRKLEVEFVRQHDMTCAPATMSALARYFGHIHDHLKIAEAICYDGTPWHKERNWCEKNGFYVCEFAVTMESAKTLIDAEIPFSLTTQAVTSAHLQACIGYDEKFGLLLLRDPTHRHYGEVVLKSLLEDHPVMGLRGMALVPKERSAELQAMNLPATRIYDLYHEFSVALDEHDQGKAEEVVESFIGEFPEAPMRYHAELRLASYKNHPAVELEKVEVLHKRFPKAQSLWLSKIHLLNRLSRYLEAKGFLAEIREKEDRHPIFDTEAGELLCQDVRTVGEGDFYLRRALRRQSGEGRVHAAYARCLDMLDRGEDALFFRRSASQLSRSFEPYASRYYSAARALGRATEGLIYLEDRARTVGGLDVAPHITYLEVLHSQDSARTPEVAEKLLQQFPESGELLLKTVTYFSGWNRHEEARNHLAKAEGKVPKAQWLRVSAKLAAWLGDRAESCQRWKELLQLNPYSVEAYEAVSRHLAEEEGRDATLVFLKESHEKMPDYLPLLRVYIEWIEGKGPRESIPLLKKMIELDPEDLWALRELALEYQRDRQFDLAVECAEEALKRDPRDDGSHCVAGHLKAGVGDTSEAIESFRESLRLSTDNLSAFKGLMDQCGTYQERLDALRFVRAEMIRQVSNGEIVPEYRERATGLISNDELLKDLELFHTERPDLWQAWYALREHLSHNGEPERGLEIAQDFTKQFPLLPRAWVELAFAHRLLGQTSEEITAFQRALELSPTWDWILRELSESQERDGLYDEALESLKRAVQSDPLAPGGHGRKASLLWKMSRRTEAIEAIKKGVTVAPYYGWGWSRMIEWTKLEKREVEVVELMTELEKDRVHYWRWWNQVADIREEMEDRPAALEALDRGLEIEPKNVTLLDQKAYTLSQEGRYSEAREVCRSLNDSDVQPVGLRSREAWILMESGQQKLAWDMMQKLSEEEPDHYFAHSQLALWAYRTNAWAQLQVAAERMIALRPEESESWGYLGIAHEELKKTEDAHHAYSRALILDPAYLYAGRHKADIERKRGDFGEAADTLAKIKHHHETSYLVADEIELSLSRNPGVSPAGIQELWEELGERSVEEEEDPYYFTDAIFEEAKRISDYQLLLANRASSGRIATAGEARAWGRRMVSAKRRKKLVRETVTYPLPDEFKASALAAVVRGENLNKREIVKMISHHSVLLGAHVDSWQAVLDYYSTHSLEEKACQWGQNWRRYIPELNAGDLASYPACVDDIRTLEEGLALRREILTEFPQWNGTKYLRVCIGFHEASAGRMEAAEEMIAGFEDREKPSAFYHTIYLQTRAMMAAHTGDRQKAEMLFGNAASLMEPFSVDKAAQKYLKHSAGVIARSLNVFRGKSKKLIKKWGHNVLKDEGGISWWWVFPILWILSQLGKCAGS